MQREMARGVFTMTRAVQTLQEAKKLFMASLLLECSGNDGIH